MFGFTSPIPERLTKLAIAFRDSEIRRTRARLAAAIFRFACLAASAWVLAYILIRSVQPYPLDAFEEYQIHKAIRWTQGASLYGDPAEENLPEAYPPFYFWTLGLWLRAFGESFFIARLLSLAALVGIVGCGCWSLRDANGRGVARLAFLTVFLCLHPLTAKFYEVSKPDTMLTLFVAIAIVTGEHRSWTEVAVSSGAILLASLTKQNAPLFLMPLCLWHGLAGRWRWAIGWGAAMGVLIAASYWLINVLSHGQFFYWVFVWTSGHGVDVWAGTMRTLQAVTVRGPVLLAVILGSLELRPRCRWTWCLIAASGVAAMGMSKAGGRENHLLPVAFIGAVLCSRWLATVWVNGYEEADTDLGSTSKDGRRKTKDGEADTSECRAPARASHPSDCRLWAYLAFRPRLPSFVFRLSSFVSRLSSFVFRLSSFVSRLSSLSNSLNGRWCSGCVARSFAWAVLFVTVWAGLPAMRDFRWIGKRAREADDWLAAVRRIDGSVAVSHHRLLARRAGADCFFSDLILEFPGLVVPAEIRRRISDQEFDYLVLETDPCRSPTPGWGDLISQNYLPSGELDFDNRSDVLPRRLYIARRLAPYNVR